MVRDTLLIVDDSELDLAILNEIFKGLFRVECFQEANRAISFLQKHTDRVCAALVDICLGRRGAGFTLLHRMQTNPMTMQLPIILITSDANKDYVISGVEQGAVDFLVKPVDPHSVQERVCSIVRSAWPAGETILDQDAQVQEDKPAENLPMEGSFSLFSCLPEQLSAEQAAQLVDGWEKKLTALCSARKGFKLTPSPVIPRLTALLCEAWRSLHADKGLTELQASYVQQAARICDIGLLGLPDEMIALGAEQPEPGRAGYMRHTELGYALLESDRPHPFMQICADVARWHHKNQDGTGYPVTQSTVTVPLSAQLVHAAMRCDLYLRKYQDNPDCFDRALRALSGEAGHTISEEMFQAIEHAREPIEEFLLKYGVGGA